MRIYFLLIFWLPILAVSTACSSETPAAPPPATATLTPQPERVTITWGFWGDPWEVEINKQLIKVFERDHPHIRVKTFHRPWNDYFKELRPKLEAGEPVPDVLFWSQPPVDVPKGYFMDLAPLMKAEAYSLKDFFPGLLIHFQIGDKIYGLPRDSDTKVIFYNKRLFNRADQPYPKEGWTWEDLRASALVIKEAEVSDYSFAYEVNNWWMIWMWQNEIQLFDHKLLPTQTYLGEPAAAEAIQFFADLTNVDQVTPPYDMLRSSEEIATMFKEGQVAMAFGNHALVPALADIEDFEWDVASLPRGQKAANLAAGAGYVIAADTPHADAAWTLLKFLSSPKGQAIFAESGVAVPARRSVAESDIFLKQKPVHNAQVFLNAVEIGEANPAFPGMNGILSLMNDEILPPVWRGEQDAATALQAALPEIKDILEANQSPPR